jgi:hypothetical protein
MKIHIASLIRQIMLVLVLVLVSAASHAASYPENEIKAGYLFHFLNFVEWPDNDKSDTAAICFLGENLLEQAMGPILGTTVYGRTLVISTFTENTPLDSFTDCRILYIKGTPSNARYREIVTALQEYPILTISDSDGFVDRGGMINLVRVDDNIGFELNIWSTGRVGIELPAKLKKLAIRIVDEEGQDE